MRHWGFGFLFCLGIFVGTPGKSAEPNRDALACLVAVAAVYPSLFAPLSPPLSLTAQVSPIYRTPSPMHRLPTIPLRPWPRVPPPDGLSEEQLVVWELIAVQSAWGRAQPVLLIYPDVLKREHLWHLARWHFDRVLRAIGRGSIPSPHFYFIAELLGSDTESFLCHMEDLADDL